MSITINVEKLYLNGSELDGKALDLLKTAPVKKSEGKSKEPKKSSNSAIHISLSKKYIENMDANELTRLMLFISSRNHFNWGLGRIGSGFNGWYDEDTRTSDVFGEVYRIAKRYCKTVGFRCPFDEYQPGKYAFIANSNETYSEIVNVTNHNNRENIKMLMSFVALCVLLYEKSDLTKALGLTDSELKSGRKQFEQIYNSHMNAFDKLKTGWKYYQLLLNLLEPRKERLVFSA